jgi:hypothetical protein
MINIEYIAEQYRLRMTAAQAEQPPLESTESNGGPCELQDRQ